MYCPKCKNEYVEGVKVCVDCGTELVESLPEEVEMDGNAPFILGKLSSEKIGELFIKYFNYAGIKTCALVPDEEEEGKYNLILMYAEVPMAVQVLNTLVGKDDMDAENDEFDLEDLIPKIQDELENLDEEEGNELLTELRTEQSTVYVNKKDKYSDFKFTGYSFIVFSVIGYIVAGLNFAGIISVFNMFSLCILTLIFTIFLGIGISSLKRAAGMKDSLSSEDEAESAIRNYIEENFTEQYMDSLMDSNMTNEENYINATNVLTATAAEALPEYNAGLIEQLVDEHFEKYCDSKEE